MTCSGRAFCDAASPSSPCAARNAARWRVTAVSFSYGKPSSRKPLPRPFAGRSLAEHAGKKPSTRHGATSSADEVDAHRAADQLAAATEHGHRMRRRARSRRAASPSPCGKRATAKPIATDRASSPSPPASSTRSAQGEIHVVAADERVVADRGPAKHQLARLFADFDQREVGRPAADVAHQQHVADFQRIVAASDRRRRPATRRPRPAVLRAG